MRKGGAPTEQVPKEKAEVTTVRDHRASCDGGSSSSGAQHAPDKITPAETPSPVDAPALNRGGAADISALQGQQASPDESGGHSSARTGAAVAAGDVGEAFATASAHLVAEPSPAAAAAATTSAAQQQQQLMPPQQMLLGWPPASSAPWSVMHAGHVPQLIGAAGNLQRPLPGVQLSSAVLDGAAEVAAATVETGVAYKRRAGRPRAPDPRDDPSIPEKRAKRIMANREAADRSKRRQRLAALETAQRAEALTVQHAAARAATAEVEDLLQLVALVAHVLLGDPLPPHAAPAPQRHRADAAGLCPSATSQGDAEGSSDMTGMLTLQQPHLSGQLLPSVPTAVGPYIAQTTLQVLPPSVLPGGSERRSQLQPMLTTMTGLPYPAAVAALATVAASARPTATLSAPQLQSSTVQSWQVLQGAGQLQTTSQTAALTTDTLCGENPVVESQQHPITRVAIDEGPHGASSSAFTMQPERSTLRPQQPRPIVMTPGTHAPSGTGGTMTNVAAADLPLPLAAHPQLAQQLLVPVTPMLRPGVVAHEDHLQQDREKPGSPT
jgi:hypothetical protein